MASGGPFFLPGRFHHGREAEELRMMAAYVLHLAPVLRDTVAAEDMDTVVDQTRAALGGKKIDYGALPGDAIRRVLGAYNVQRLRSADKTQWPRHELQHLAETLCPLTKVLPPPLPCEYVPEGVAWWNFGAFAQGDEWLGHGFFFRQRPSTHDDPLENAGGSAMNDYDLLEDGFLRLKKARVLAADYELLRHDYPELGSLDQAAIDTWLIENCAYLSNGQYRRLCPGGDHHDLLGLDAASSELESLLDTESRCKAGLRIRSGGRAATFFVKDRYWFQDNLCKAELIEVKGVGTHQDAAIGAKVTGLLNLADALKELAFQRLIQRLVELRGESWSTVRYYALLDTGLHYVKTNPATGWEDERCVLLVRQPQSRLFDSYEGFNFSGVAPKGVLAAGHGSSMMALCQESGMSAEFLPSALLPALGAESEWNLQVDAPCTHLMDFSDFYVLPDSRLPPHWQMSLQATVDALALERPLVLDLASKDATLSVRLFKEELEPEEVVKRLEARRRELSAEAKIREAAARVEDGTDLIMRGKPKYCMCWFQELDDSEVSQWTLRRASEIGRELRMADGSAPGALKEFNLLQQIDDWLPQSLPKG